MKWHFYGLAAFACAYSVLTACSGPIMMTTMSALLGALRLALGRRAGSELRQPLGLTMVGGLLLSQPLTLFTTPVIYLYVDQFQLWINNRRHQKRPDASMPKPPPQSREQAVPPLEGTT